jgi:hypothetical protein
MAKPIDHAKSSARKFGGVPEDYLPIHQEMDNTKSAHPDSRHRAVMHSAYGIFLLEKIFGKTIKNSAGRDVHVRDVGEQHVIEDLNFIPALSDWLDNLTWQPWMNGAAYDDPILAPKGRTVVNKKGKPRPKTQTRPEDDLGD